MGNKCKAAGGWNIACGLLILVPMMLIMLLLWPMAFLGLIGVEAGAGIAAAVILMITSLFGIMLVPFLIVSVAFIVMGVSLRSKREKGILLKIFLTLLLFCKALLAFSFIYSGAYIWLAIFLVSMVYDIVVLFTRKEKLA